LPKGKGHHFKEKRKSPLTSFFMEQELDELEDPMTATPGHINPTATPSNITLTATPSNITPTATPIIITPTATPSNVTPPATPSNVIPTAKPGSITLTATPSNVTPTATPSNVTLTATPSNVNQAVQLQRATPSLAWPPDLIPILQHITATPCRHSSKPLFVFDLSIEAVNRNFMLLNHKFSGDL
jgi:hypothetical protein